jgi:DNA-binding transcriptional LysR family regulator
MLASLPASMLNQNRPDLGIPNRFNLKTSRSRGITLGPESVLAAEFAAGWLVRVLPEYEGPTRSMYALYPAGRRSTVKVCSFVDALVKEFGHQ